MGISEKIKAAASAAGFDACGIARFRRLDRESEKLSEWLARGYHAGMWYMENHREKRNDPSLLVENCRSVIVCLARCLRAEPEPGIPFIASYARSDDYHYLLRSRLDQLLGTIRTEYPGVDGKVFTDSAPVMERTWAIEAGLGRIGRNGLLIHPRFGSFCLIGGILTDLEADGYDSPLATEEPDCDGCDRCIVSCPTGAIRKGGMIDSNRCLSYHTIENRGPVPEPLVPKLGDRLFGCDTCQSVCPGNLDLPDTPTLFGLPSGEWSVPATEWLGMTRGEFRRRFGHTPLMRCGLKKIKTTLRQAGWEPPGEDISEECTGSEPGRQ